MHQVREKTACKAHHARGDPKKAKKKKAEKKKETELAERPN